MAFQTISDRLPKLNSLQITHNLLENIEDIEHLKYCDSLSVVDLSNNRLKDDNFIEVSFATIKEFNI